MVEPRKRPRRLCGETTKIATGCGSAYVTVNRDEGGKPVEVFIALGKAGGCAAALLSTVARLLSASLRAGVSPESLVKYMSGIRCPSSAWDDGQSVTSCADAVSRVLQQEIELVKQNELVEQKVIGVERENPEC